MYTSPQSIDCLKTFLNKPPVDVFGAARALGLSIFQSDLGENVSGKLVKNELITFPDGLVGGPADWSIIVNNRHPYVRQRFTVAHEIGHFVMHRNASELSDGELEDNIFYRSELGGPREAEANKFAANLLMPMRLVMKNYFEGRTPEDMAKLFEVSREAMDIRLGKIPGS